jgi:hypothetical protein
MVGVSALGAGFSKDLSEIKGTSMTTSLVFKASWGNTALCKAKKREKAPNIKNTGFFMGFLLAPRVPRVPRKEQRRENRGHIKKAPLIVVDKMRDRRTHASLDTNDTLFSQFPQVFSFILVLDKKKGHAHPCASPLSLFIKTRLEIA